MVSLKKSIKNKKAAQGIGTLIIFIALILVAAVAAAVLISTSSNLKSKALDTGKQAIEIVNSGIDVTSIYANGISGSKINGDTSNYTIKAKLGIGSESLNFNDLAISIQTDEGEQIVIFNNNESSPTFNKTAFAVENILGGTSTDGILKSGEVINLEFTAENDVSENEKIIFNRILY